MKNDTIFPYNDGIGKVHYISHMGIDITVCNAARVSFAKELYPLTVQAYEDHKR